MPLMVKGMAAANATGPLKTALDQKLTTYYPAVGYGFQLTPPAQGELVGRKRGGNARLGWRGAAGSQTGLRLPFAWRRKRRGGRSK